MPENSEGKFLMFAYQQSGLRSAVIPSLLFLVIGLLVACASPNGGTSEAPEEGEGGPNAVAGGAADEYAVVDCLLPGQVRRLGTQVTYLTARRPIKTTAEDCAIRGGEYVASDRADYATALKVWLDPAQGGDAEAQYYVATIYEKGPQGQPDYPLAATWYRKAADNGYSRAAINLGRLYEQGLGVGQSNEEAFKWYARASGLNESSLSNLISEDVAGRIQTLERTVAERESEIEGLRAELKEVNQKLIKLRSRLREQASLAEEERQTMQSVEVKYQRVQSDLQAALSTPERQDDVARYQEQLERLKQELSKRQNSVAERDQEIRQLQQKITTLEDSAGRIQALERTVAEREQEIQKLRVDLSQTTKEVTELKGQLQDRTSVVGDESRELEIVKAKYKDLQDQLEKVRSLEDALSNPKQKETVRRQQEELEMVRQDLAQRKERLEERNVEVAQLQQRIASLESRKENQALALAAEPAVDLGLDGPSIEILDPPLIASRGVLVAPRRVPLATPVGNSRAVTGRVLAPAGLRTLLVNGQANSIDEHGIFTVNLPALRSKKDEIPVDIVAVDVQNKRAVTKLLMLPHGASRVAIQPSRRVDSGFGGYYALVIGNDHYRHWDPLKNAIADATAISKILRERYGFQVTLLKDASRRDTLKALNQFRKKLTERDNLLIYYAGHGYLEPDIDRGYWIPVEAELNDNSDWILLPTITDLLQLMTAKHILVVADSCFAGKLTRTSLAKLRPGLSEDARLEMLRTLAQKRVRTAMTSGGVQPVLDSGGEGHSVFANALLGVLQENTDILETERLFWAVRTRVMRSATRLNVEQIPTYSPIHLAGHESLGDFIFVPQQG